MALLLILPAAGRLDSIMSPSDENVGDGGLRVAQARTIILASTSPRRTALLTQIGIAHTVIKPPSDDESVAANLAPDQVVLQLAERKAQSVARGLAQEASVVGCDTVVSVKGAILGKPADERSAMEMLAALSGQWHEVYSGVAVVNVPEGVVRVGYRRVEVEFAELTKGAIAAYVKTGEPLDKAGAYSIQGRAAPFIRGIRGDYYAVVGLPLQLTVELLAQSGVAMPGPSL